MAMQKVTCDPRREQRQQHDVADEHGDGREQTTAVVLEPGPTVMSSATAARSAAQLLHAYASGKLVQLHLPSEQKRHQNRRRDRRERVAEPDQHAQGIGHQERGGGRDLQRVAANHAASIEERDQHDHSDHGSEAVRWRDQHAQGPEQGRQSKCAYPNVLVGRLTLKADQHTDRKRDGDLDRARARRKPRDLLKSE